MPLGLKPLNLFMKNKENMYFETRSARNTTSLLNPLTLVMGIPSALCLLPSAFLKFLTNLGIAEMAQNRFKMRIAVLIVMYVPIL